MTFEEVVACMNQHQKDSWNKIWNKIWDDSMMVPAIGFSEEGVCLISWNFSTVQQYVFTLEIYVDGRLDWFFRDRDLELFFGSEDPVYELPVDAVGYLSHWRCR